MKNFILKTILLYIIMDRGGCNGFDGDFENKDSHPRGAAYSPNPK